MAKRKFYKRTLKSGRVIVCSMPKSRKSQEVTRTKKRKKTRPGPFELP